MLIIQDYTTDTDIEHFKTNTEGMFQDYYNTQTKGLENEERLICMEGSDIMKLSSRKLSLARTTSSSDLGRAYLVVEVVVVGRGQHVFKSEKMTSKKLFSLILKFLILETQCF